MRQSDSIAVLPGSPDIPSLASKRICVHLRASLREDFKAQRSIETLAQAGFNVSVVDIDSNPSKLVDEHLEGVTITHLGISNWSDASSFKPGLMFKFLGLIIQSALQLLRTPADIYHAGDLRALPAAYIAACLRRKPLIFETYELPLTQPYLTKHRLPYGIAVRVLKTMMRRCNAVIATSSFHAAETHQRYGGPTPTLVRNIPVYQRVVPNDRLRRHLNLDPETRIALYQGGFQVGRSLDKMIEAARFLAPGNVIVLKGWGEMQTQLERQIDELGVGDRVKMAGAVPYEELLAWTASADIGLILHSPDWSVSVKLCLPNKLFEYLMAGLPVLTSPLDSVVEIIQHYDVGCVVPSLEPETIGKAINTMLADRQALKRMRANALQASEKDLHWEIESRQLIQLYQRLLA